MKVLLCLSFVLTAGFFICGILTAEEPQWEYAGYGMKEAYAKIVVCDPAKKGVIYAATDYFAYISVDNGKNWKEIFAAPGKENTINFIAPAFDGRAALLAAAKDGLYAVGADGGGCKKIGGLGAAAQKGVNCVVTLASAPDYIYAAGGSGVFFSADFGRTFRRLGGRAFGAKAGFIAVTPAAGDIYVASDKGIFASRDNGARWQRVYSVLRKERVELPGEEEAPQEDEESFFSINCLAINPLDDEQVYAGTSEGALVSYDRGKTWSFMANAGLAANNVRHLLVVNEGLPVIYGSASVIYAATPKGVFRYDEGAGRWSHLYKGAGFSGAQFLSISQEGRILWAAADNGAFKLAANGKDEERPPLAPLRHCGVSFGFKGEPGIRQVQNAAIKYAEVYPDKILKWRRQARLKPFFPEVSLDYDKSVYMSANNFYVGPKDWGVGLKWNVGDMLFSTDQTSIDVRSRLMVQLRDDILDEVTRLYYERRRLKAELAMSPPNSESARYEKILRLEELTAGIDGLTGGYFSGKMGNE